VDRSAYFRTLDKQESRHGTHYGNLPRTATSSETLEREPIARPVNPRTETIGDKLGYFPLSFLSLEGSSLCFEKPLSRNVGADPRAEVNELATHWRFQAATYPSFESASQSGDWPAPESVPPAQVTLREKGSKFHADHAVAVVCMPAPSLAAPASFLIVTALSLKSSNEHFALAWELE
jgi:hypothetical protein